MPGVSIPEAAGTDGALNFDDGRLPWLVVVVVMMMLLLLLSVLFC